MPAVRIASLRQMEIVCDASSDMIVSKLKEFVPNMQQTDYKHVIFIVRRGVLRLLFYYLNFTVLAIYLAM